MRLLVDIAERSLSESPFQDPTTAVQAIDRLHDILRQLARRPFPDGRVHDEDGEIRLLVKTMTWENYVHLAFDEIRMAGAGSPQVSRRLVAALMDLRRVALPERIEVLDEQRRCSVPRRSRPWTTSGTSASRSIRTEKDWERPRPSSPAPRPVRSCDLPVGDMLGRTCGSTVTSCAGGAPRRLEGAPFAQSFNASQWIRRSPSASPGDTRRTRERAICSSAARASTSARR